MNSYFLTVSKPSVLRVLPCSGAGFTVAQQSYRRVTVPHWEPVGAAWDEQSDEWLCTNLSLSPSVSQLYFCMLHLPFVLFL